MTYTLTRKVTADGILLTAEHDIVPDWSDQTGWFDPTKVTTPVTLIGCGGIGSNVALELITMGFTRFVLYDDDVIEPRNLASQKAYRPQDLYKPKALTLGEILISYGAVEVLVRGRRLTEDDVFESTLVIGGVDSMASRKIIWQVMENSLGNVELYLDGRLGGEIAQVFAIDPLDADWYTERWLFGDDRAATDINCTMRAIVYPATQLSAVMCRHLSLWYRAEPICQLVQIDMVNLKFQRIGNIEV